jgi:hypothetical protein
MKSYGPGMKGSTEGNPTFRLIFRVFGCFQGTAMMLRSHSKPLLEFQECRTQSTTRSI